MAEGREYLLNIQCAWRIDGPAGIVARSYDLNYRSGPDAYDTPDDWDRTVAGTNRRDEMVRTSFGCGPYIVEKVSADSLGGFSLGLVGGFALDVLPDDSLDGEYSEHWRLLHLGDASSQFVVSCNGISD